MYTSYDALNTYLTVTKDSTSTNSTNGKLWINDVKNKILSMADWPFLEDEWYADSVASQESYRMAHSYRRLLNVWYINSDNKYMPKEIMSNREWTEKSALSTTSDYPDFFHIFADYIHFYPKFSTAGIDIHMRFIKSEKEFSNWTNYTTGTLSVTQNTSAVTGSGTSWTSSMIGRSILLDGLWYEISNVGSTTSITLAKTFEGATITAGTYTIGEVTSIPDGFQDMLWQRPASIYFMQKGEEERANFYLSLYKDGLIDLKSRFLTKTSDQVFNSRNSVRSNPNSYPENIG